MTDDKPESPHDALVRAIFGSPAHMAEELRAVLPRDVAAHVDLTSLAPLPAHFADSHLDGAESDLLFSARVAGWRALIYVLIEHQSTPDRFMPLRLLRYVARILDDYRLKNPRARRLPAVIPVVLAHDLRAWPYPLDLGALYDLTSEAKAHIAPYLPDFRFILDDLAATDAAELVARASSPLVTLTLFVLKRARHTTDLLGELRSIAHQFAALEHAQAPREQIASALWYIWHVGRVTPDDLLEFARSHAGPTLENIMKTAAEQLLDRGRAEGRTEGEAKGKAETVLRLMQLRFGAIPPEVAHAIQTASVPQLDRWVERVLSADRAEDVVHSPQ
jgi:predicted transposase/invertase (TIGR01784 family)